MQIEEDDNVIKRQTDQKSWTLSDLFTLHYKLEEQLAGQSNSTLSSGPDFSGLSRALLPNGYGVTVLVVGGGGSAQLC